MTEKLDPKSLDKRPKKGSEDFKRFEKPYWGEPRELAPQQIVEWLERHREMMMELERSKPD